MRCSPDLVDLAAVRQDHVEDTLKGVAGDPRLLVNQIQVLGEGTFPILLAELIEVLALRDKRYDGASTTHFSSSLGGQCSPLPNAIHKLLLTVEAPQHAHDLSNVICCCYAAFLLVTH